MGQILWKSKCVDLSNRSSTSSLFYSTSQSFDQLLDALINTIGDSKSITSILNSIPHHIVATQYSNYITPNLKQAQAILAFFSTGEIVKINEVIYESEIEFIEESNRLKSLLLNPTMNRHAHLLTLFGVLAFQRSISSSSSSCSSSSSQQQQQQQSEEFSLNPKLKQVFSLVTISEAYPHSLSELNSPVSEVLLLNFLKSSVSALSALQSMQISHSALKAKSIFFRESDGSIKIENPLVCRIASNCQMNAAMQTKKQGAQQAGYLSPLESSMFFSPPIRANHNAYLSDVFVLGLILLELASAEGISEFFQVLHHIRVNSLLIHAQHLNYTTPTNAVLVKMLKEHEEYRPDFLTLQTIVDKLTMPPNIRLSIQAENVFKNKPAIPSSVAATGTTLYSNLDHSFSEKPGNTSFGNLQTHMNSSFHNISSINPANSSRTLSSNSNNNNNNKEQQQLINVSTQESNQFMKFDMISSPCSPYLLRTNEANQQKYSPESRKRSSSPNEQLTSQRQVEIIPSRLLAKNHPSATTITPTIIVTPPPSIVPVLYAASSAGIPVTGTSSIPTATTNSNPTEQVPHLKLSISEILQKQQKGGQGVTVAATVTAAPIATSKLIPSNGYLINKSIAGNTMPMVIQMPIEVVPNPMTTAMTARDASITNRSRDLSMSRSQKQLNTSASRSPLGQRSDKQSYGQLQQQQSEKSYIVLAPQNMNACRNIQYYEKENNQLSKAGLTTSKGTSSLVGKNKYVASANGNNHHHLNPVNAQHHHLRHNHPSHQRQTSMEKSQSFAQNASIVSHSRQLQQQQQQQQQQTQQSRRSQSPITNQSHVQNRSTHRRSVSKENMRHNNNTTLGGTTSEFEHRRKSPSPPPSSLFKKRTDKDTYTKMDEQLLKTTRDTIYRIHKSNNNNNDNNHSLLNATGASISSNTSRLH